MNTGLTPGHMMLRCHSDTGADSSDHTDHTDTAPDTEIYDLFQLFMAQQVCIYLKISNI